MSAFTTVASQHDQYYSEEFAPTLYNSQSQWTQQLSEPYPISGSAFLPIGVPGGPVHYTSSPSSPQSQSHHIQYFDNDCQHLHWVPDPRNGSPAISASSPASISSYTSSSYYAPTPPAQSPSPSPSVSSSSSPPPFVGPIRNRRPHTKAQKSSHIPRPRNAFILFRSHFNETNPPKVSPTGKRLNQNELSREVGRVWNAMSKEEQQPWKDKYEEELRLHRLKYPDYAYEPRRRAEGRKPRKDRKVKTVSREVRVHDGSESDSGASIASFAYPSPASSSPALSPESVPFCFPGDGEAGSPKQVVHLTDNERPSTLNTELDMHMGSFNFNDSADQVDADPLRDQLSALQIPLYLDFGFNFDFSDVPAPADAQIDAQYDALVQSYINLNAFEA
ncbi:hypothetical protein CC1G_06427 [Coprinopsis cinerea okayama7|uniref:HMG box domain-containing protein n=1 Tax=Coprinopsis cinerea (strain Okayama-7 / 130 / ATCC MYA-4618 / FGSC 9003) TaxID=240176 RepID=A8NTZ6_COPC7|nr:hypothetical protein CC1G_06427 [Coprinopsis cinerea okayama7\|eukprot:XP_001836342.1 hypothetical protein CC1G_06427 [Coprinopsis cinerea okayama7\